MKCRAEARSLESALVNNVAEVVDALAKAGIEFSIHAVNGHFTLSPEEVPRFLRDPDGFRARVHGVPKDHYVAWATHVARPTCPATTRAGRPCEGYVNAVDHPQAFQPGVSEYCTVHQRTGTL